MKIFSIEKTLTKLYVGKEVEFYIRASAEDNARYKKKNGHIEGASDIMSNYYTVLTKGKCVEIKGDDTHLGNVYTLVIKANGETFHVRLEE